MRTAAIVVGIADGSNQADYIKTWQDLGAPVALVSTPEQVNFWKFTTRNPEFLVSVANHKLNSFFNSNRNALLPSSIYRAKNIAVDRQPRQLDFVDLGLMPFLERNIGDKLSDSFTAWVKELIPEWQVKVGKTLAHNEFLLRSVFRLLAAKILADKSVTKFTKLRNDDAVTVIEKVAKHCGSTDNALQYSSKATKLLTNCWREINDLSSLRNMSTESLGVIYEKSFISKQTRKELGTHSTPPWLADYMMWQVEDWFKELPPEERVVYEPACGHGAFLVAALRMLNQFAFEERMPSSNTQKYVRQMLYGVDIDPFALEIARLSLTLTDIPNPNGWKLHYCDLLRNNPLQGEFPLPGLIFTNPPYEKIERTKRETFATKHYLRYTHILEQLLPHIRYNGILGFVAPRSFMSIKTGKDIRQKLLSEFEIREVTQFPDKVFTFSDQETCIVLARKRNPPSVTSTRYAYVNEDGIANFRKLHQASYHQEAMLDKSATAPNFSFIVPKNLCIWDYLAENLKLDDVAAVGRGLEFRKGSPKGTEGELRQMLRYASADMMQHSAPQPEDVRFSDSEVSRWVTAKHQGIPQLIVNAARISRQAWCVTALIDYVGHFTSAQWITIRTTADNNIPLPALWALLNSPFANLFVHTISDKRHINTDTYRKIPLPFFNNITSFSSLKELANKYIKMAQCYYHSASDLETEAELKRLRFMVDAEVLRLYDLPPRYERELLDAFTGLKRPGVPFVQEYYFPTSFGPAISLSKYISDSFKNATAGNIRKIDFAKVLSPEMKQALATASEVYSDN